MKLSKLIILLIIMNNLYSQDTYKLHPYDTNKNKNAQRGGNQENERILKNKFIKNIDPRVAQENISAIDRYQRIMNETLSLSYLKKKQKMSFKDISTMYFHPQYTSTILLPSGYEINGEPIISFETKNIKKAKNFIAIQPADKFQNGNIILTVNNDKNNFLIQIMANKIQYSNLLLDTQLKQYMINGNYLSLIYQFVEYTNIDPLSVAMEYEIVNGENSLELIFRKDNDYDTVRHKDNDLIYYLIRDSKNPDIEYRNIPLRISDKYEVQESSAFIKALQDQ